VGRGSFLVVVVAVGIGYAKTTQRARQAEVAVHSLAITMLRRGRVTGPSQGQTRPGASLSGYEICGVSDRMLDWSCVLHGTRGRHERLDRRLRLSLHTSRTRTGETEFGASYEYMTQVDDLRSSRTYMPHGPPPAWASNVSQVDSASLLSPSSR
jgi:hypothetical protein